MFADPETLAEVGSRKDDPALFSIWRKAKVAEAWAGTVSPFFSVAGSILMRLSPLSSSTHGILRSYEKS